MTVPLYRRTLACLLVSILSLNVINQLAVFAGTSERIFPKPTSALARSSSFRKPSSNTVIHLCLASPQISKGTVTSDGFGERIRAYLSGDQSLLVTMLVDSSNEASTRLSAAKENCDFVLFTGVSSNDGKTAAGRAGETIGRVFGGGILGGVTKAEEKFNITVTYTLEVVQTNSKILSGKAEGKSADADKAADAVVTKLSKPVLAKIAEASGKLPTKQTTPDNLNQAQVVETNNGVAALSDGKEKPRLVVQTAHGGSVTDFAYNYNGSLIATLGNDGTVKLWVASSGKELLTLSGFHIGGFSFGPDGKSLACLSRDGTVRIFDVATGKAVRVIPSIVRKTRSSDSNPIVAMYSLLSVTPLPVVYSNDGRLLVTSASDGVKVRDVASGRVLQTFLSPQEGSSGGQVRSIALSPDGKTVAAVSGDTMNEIKIWSTERGKELQTIPSGFAQVTALEFSQDGLSLVLGSSHGSIKLVQVKSGKMSAPILWPSDKIAGTNAAIKKGASLLSKIAGATGVGGRLGTASEILDTVEGAVNMASLINGTYVARSIRSVALSHDGKVIAFKSGDDSIRVIDSKNGNVRYNIGAEKPASDDDTRSAPSFYSICPIRFSPDGTTLNSCSEFKNIKRWNAETGHETYSLAVSKRGAFESSPFANLFIHSSNARFLNDKTILTSAITGGISKWDLEKGTAPKRLTNDRLTSAELPISSDGKFVIRLEADNKSIVIQDLETGRTVNTIGTEGVIGGAFFSPDMRFVVVPTYDPTRGNYTTAFGLNFMDPTSGQKLHSLNDMYFYKYEFSGDGKLLAYLTVKNEIAILQTDTWRETSRIKLLGTPNIFIGSPLAFSSDDKFLASVESKNNSLRVWDISNGSLIKERSIGADDQISDLAFRPGQRTLTYVTFTGLFHWDLESNQLTKSKSSSDNWGKLSYSPNGELIAVGGAENRIRLFDVVRDKELASMIDPNSDDWLVITPEGRLDTSRLEDIEEVHWVLPSEPFTVQSLEVYMRFYYEPRLLSRLVANEEFAAVPDLSELNRTQPNVKIKEVTPALDDTVDVSVEVASNTSATQRSKSGSLATSGVYDVRLFRDGQLVGYSTPGSKLATLMDTPTSSDAIAEIAAWRQTHQVTLDASGNRTLVFKGIRLPQRPLASQIVFSTYGFNEDRIKSLSNSYTLNLPASTHPRKGRAFVITVGVNAFENSSFNLSFAANDARIMSEVVSRQLRSSGQFEEVVPVTLTSDYERRGRDTIVTRRDASKANFRSILELLAGHEPEPEIAQQNIPAVDVSAKQAAPVKKGRRGGGAVKGKRTATKVSPLPVPTTVRNIPLQGILNSEKLRAATPDDLVLILYSSHGYADRAGNFYLLPYDTSVGTQKVFTEQLRKKSISSDDLSLWLRDVDAGEIVLIVDACHSAAAVEGREFKPGPMGSRGLGQLSYDKGMRILTATQSDNVALENKTIKQGLLTYALTSDGLEAWRADFKPQDKNVMMLEWLEYGETRVPLLNEEMRTGQISTNAASVGDKPRVVLVDASRGIEDTYVESSTTQQTVNASSGSITSVRGNTARLQQPALFDFARRPRDTILARH